MLEQDGHMEPDQSKLSPDAPTLHEPSAFEIRAKLRDLVINDLLGPAGGPEEEIDGRERLRDRYLVGSLAPRGSKLSASDDDDLTLGTGEGDDGEGAATPDTKGPVWTLPSSFGLSFMVEQSVPELIVTARWGQYRREESVDRLKEDGTPFRVWKRTPMGGIPVTIPLREYPSESEDGLNQSLATPDPDQPKVRITGRIRPHDAYWFITLFLDNAQQEPPTNKDAYWLFQAELEVTGNDGAPVFVHKTVNIGPTQDTDTLEGQMLYRETLEFATGHGVAVHVDRAPGDPTRAVRLVTRSAPEFEVPKTEAPGVNDHPLLADLVLDMETLSHVEMGGFSTALSALTRAYGAWIDQRRLEANTSSLADHQQAASLAIGECERALARIDLGIDLLDADPVAAQAFRFANRAMHLQRVHTKLVDARRTSAKPEDETFGAHDIPRNRSWRPFQLAFILSNIASLSDLHHPDRATDPLAAADLLWFPTGGGKTEAYLGLTAYTLAIRRLQGEIAGHDGESGVGVFMRYTLRLLTLQQFQRATALICACEVIRREDPDTWGQEPFRVGLWVGMSMTPNRTSQAEKAIRNEKGTGFTSGTGNPHQLTYCPWCGTSIDRKAQIDVEVPEKGAGRTFIYCGDKLGQCEFSRKQSPRAGLPILVVDEEIYRNPPSLLIATVDKFAQMPWKGAIQNLFGRVEQRCERHGFHAADFDDASKHNKTATMPAARSHPVKPIRPPDLIIQDELHLISGPLGSMVGLYETAVDELCTWTVDDQRVRPKVIASTATIRRAPDQVHNLFLRDVNVFPPSGLDARDNFFSIQRKSSGTSPGRLYLGICARGTRLKAALIRVYIALLAASQTLYEEYGGKHVDPYMTLVGYFGALRELGGMRRLVDDDVTQRLRFADERGFKRRGRPVIRELTSRLNSEQVPQVLDELGITYDQKSKEQKVYPIDVLLATNMISVGVDVPRLGVMAVAGQPKNTAEYIQATSRVGREAPGLVVTIYNWNRPRDLSHYEGFEHYHATLYRQVEPLSVTPFAPRALDRGLSSVLTSLVRLDDNDYADNKGAGRIGHDNPDMKAAAKLLANRAMAVTKDSAVEEQILPMLEKRIAAWEHLAEGHGGSEIAYEERRDGTSIGLLSRPEDDAWGMFTALSSLRDVEPGIGMILKEYSMDDQPQLQAPIDPTEGEPA